MGAVVGSNPEHPKNRIIIELSLHKTFSYLIFRTQTLCRVIPARVGAGIHVDGLVVALRVTPVFSATGLFLFSP